MNRTPAASPLRDRNRPRSPAADNREQQIDLDRVAADTQVKLGELAKAIQARRENGFDAGQAVVLTNIGKRTMDSIRTVVARMEAREDAIAVSAAGKLPDADAQFRKPLDYEKFLGAVKKYVKPARA